jgi:hypothetical protein
VSARTAKQQKQQQPSKTPQNLKEVRMPTKSKGLDERVLMLPALNLTGWILSEAARISELEGFGWKPTEDPPDGFDAVLLAYQHCRESGERFPVLRSTEAESSIYAGVEANHAFRFLHDMTHVRLELGFDPDAELYVAVEHLQMLRRSGFSLGSLEWQLLHADTVGQLVAHCPAWVEAGHRQ